MKPPTVPNDYMTSPARLGSQHGQHSPGRTASLNQRQRTHRYARKEGKINTRISTEADRICSKLFHLIRQWFHDVTGKGGGGTIAHTQVQVSLPPLSRPAACLCSASVCRPSPAQRCPSGLKPIRFTSSLFSQISSPHFGLPPHFSYGSPAALHSQQHTRFPTHSLRPSPLCHGSAIPPTIRYPSFI